MTIYLSLGRIIIEKKKKDDKMEILNREAKYRYFILDEIECGISLVGTEIKSIRDGKCNIKDSYAIIRNNEVMVLNIKKVISLIMILKEQENFYYIKVK